MFYMTHEQPSPDERDDEEKKAWAALEELKQIGGIHRHELDTLANCQEFSPEMLDAYISSFTPEMSELVLFFRRGQRILLSESSGPMISDSMKEKIIQVLEELEATIPPDIQKKFRLIDKFVEARDRKLLSRALSKSQGGLEELARKALAEVGDKTEVKPGLISRASSISHGGLEELAKAALRQVQDKTENKPDPKSKMSDADIFRLTAEEIDRLNRLEKKAGD